jgi:hypothetical protein
VLDRFAVGILMDLRPVWGGNRNLTVAALLLACPLMWIGDELDRRSAALRDYRTAEATVCESQLSGETPKYWASPEELLPRYADGVLVGRHTEG